MITPVNENTALIGKEKTTQAHRSLKWDYQKNGHVSRFDKTKKDHCKNAKSMETKQTS